MDNLISLEPTGPEWQLDVHANDPLKDGDRPEAASTTSHRTVLLDLQVNMTSDAAVSFPTYHSW